MIISFGDTPLVLSSKTNDKWYLRGWAGSWKAIDTPPEHERGGLKLVYMFLVYMCKISIHRTKLTAGIVHIYHNRKLPMKFTNLDTIHTTDLSKYFTRDSHEIHSNDSFSFFYYLFIRQTFSQYRPQFIVAHLSFSGI